MSLNQRKAGVILSYIQMALGAVIMLLYTPIMLKLLGQSEYGIYNLASSVVSYLSIFNFSLGSAYVKYYMQHKTEGDDKAIKRLNGMFLVIFLSLSALALIAGGIIVANTHVIFGAKLSTSEIQKMRIAMAIMVVNLAIIMPVNMFSSYIAVNERYVYPRVIQLIKTIINPFVMLPVLFMGGKAVGLVLATSILSVVFEGALTLYAIIRLKMRFAFDGINPKAALEVGRFSLFILLNVLIDQLNNNISKILLGIYQGVKAVAVFGLAATLRMYFQSFSSLIYTVFVPHIHRLVNENNNSELTKLFTRVGRIQFIVLSMITMCFAVIGKEFMYMWGGAEYMEAYPIALILFVVSIIPLIQNTGEEIQRAKNMHHYRTFIYAGIVVLNVLISIPLCRAYGAIGCTVGMVLSIFAGSGIALNVLYQKKMGINVIYFWKNIFAFVPGLIIPAIAGILIRQFFPLENIFFFALGALVFVLVFSVSIWCISLNNYEKTLIKELVQKVLKMVKR